MSDFMAFLPENFLIPDLTNIVFEYANSHDFVLQQIQQLEETKTKQTETNIFYQTTKTTY